MAAVAYDDYFELAILRPRQEARQATADNSLFVVGRYHDRNRRERAGRKPHHPRVQVAKAGQLDSWSTGSQQQVLVNEIQDSTVTGDVELASKEPQLSPGEPPGFAVSYRDQPVYVTLGKSPRM